MAALRPQTYQAEAGAETRTEANQLGRPRKVAPHHVDAAATESPPANLHADYITLYIYLYIYIFNYLSIYLSIYQFYNFLYNLIF